MKELNIQNLGVQWGKSIESDMTHPVLHPGQETEGFNSLVNIAYKTGIILETNDFEEFLSQNVKFQNLDDSKKDDFICFLYNRYSYIKSFLDHKNKNNMYIWQL